MDSWPRRAIRGRERASRAALEFTWQAVPPLSHARGEFTSWRLCSAGIKIRMNPSAWQTCKQRIDPLPRNSPVEPHGARLHRRPAHHDSGTLNNSGWQIGRTIHTSERATRSLMASSMNFPPDNLFTLFVMAFDRICTRDRNLNHGQAPPTEDLRSGLHAPSPNCAS